MRIAAYVGTSVALAASVLLRAAYERPNFYSACVYLSQSNACLMILTNLVLLLTASFMYALQRLLYGPLRPMEVERLYEHAWFAITETLLAMTIFRDDVGVRFFVMFVSLIAGKIWQWIGAGRVEFVEQQPPTSNEIFFHSRLASSLLLSIVYDMVMLGYCVNTVLRQARPNMIVMFGFEYALLLIESFATFFRHILCLVDLTVQSKQTEAKRQEMLEERRAERQHQREAAGEGVLTEAELAAEDIEVDDNEIDVPGWEGKGRWVFYLDLAKDFAKLTIYMAFFVILMTFHGLPIHIMRDVLLTFRSFHKRIYDFLRYRNATRDMNSRYPDATSEDLGENNICIICREEMRPWTTPEQAQPPAGGAAPAPTPQRPIDERHRAKKLPCGHCLHISCLRSWLERQQACPTCRQPVLVEETRQRQQANRANPAVNAGAQPGLQQGAQNGIPQDGNAQQPALPRMRQIQFGPFRIGYGVRAVNLNNAQAENPLAQILEQGRQQQEQLHQQQQQQRGGQSDRSARALLREATADPLRANSVVAQTMWLDQLERRLVSEIQALNVAQHQLHLVRALQAEYMRLRRVAAATAVGGAQPAQDAQSPLANMFAGLNTDGLNLNAPLAHDLNQPRLFNPSADQPVLEAHDPNLPQGLTLPPGWTLLPLHRADATLGQDSGSQGPNHASTARSTAQSATDAAASLQTWNDTMTRTLEEARNRNYTPSDSSAQAPPPTTTTNGTETAPPGFREIPINPNDPGATVQTTLGPQRFPTNIANQLLAQHGNEPVPIGSAAHVPTSAGPANSDGSNTLSSSAHSSHPVATGPSEASTDTVPTTSSEESSAKAQRPNTADAHDSAVQSEEASSSTHASEQQVPSLQPTVEDGEDDEN
ncbi:Zinc finger RING-type protein [Lasiodiplodia theobromae]|nr:Zinc finger RING-type protein [Lasiodiplodia theobromae]